jgi:hypothetical protein
LPRHDSARKQKPSPDHSSEGFALTKSCGLLRAARWADQAAGAGAAAVSRTRSRVRCADQRDRRYNHQEIFHRILLLNSLRLTRHAGKPTLRSDQGTRRWNRRPIRADRLTQNEISKRFVARGGINERPRRCDKNSDTKGTAGATLFLLVGLRGMARASVHWRRHLRAALSLLHPGRGGPARRGRKEKQTTEEGANYQMQNRSHARTLIYWSGQIKFRRKPRSRRCYDCERTRCFAFPYRLRSRADL